MSSDRTPGGAHRSTDTFDPRIEGPWSHRDVSANGGRFHIAELGEGPLVLLVHGWPQFWWTWRHQLTALADAGFRAVAVDLRGVGGSDRTPRGYEPSNMALDLTGIIRSLGAPNAVLVGHDLGGFLAWTAAVMRPALVRRLAVASSAHPRRYRRALMTDRKQIAAADHLLGLQRPWVPERQLVADDAALVGEYLTDWTAPGHQPDEKALLTYRHAMQLSNTRHCSIEPYRWLMRSMGRPDGLQYSRRMRRPVRVPTLHLHGAADPVLLARTAAGSGEYVEAPYRWRLLDGIGHYPQEEDPEGFSRELVNWLRDPEPDRR
ncbi:pimeloyl-ACP methyl ester carboxylesterase [Streptomyces sp. 846.5]|jgi:pimeloyl-ACP methyl ester carboxylesterase|nr:alpha/beta hydrolase [Streptomyces sp. 846.5]TDU05593.1 pimeloyl-ACP methyl ester carboxylesterase [Streptomyces sp. 846.5]